MKKSNNAQSVARKRLKRRRIVAGKRVFKENQKRHLEKRQRFVHKQPHKMVDMTPPTQKKSLFAKIQSWLRMFFYGK